MKVSILVRVSSVMLSIADPQYFFTTANHFLLAAGEPSLFDVELVGAKREIKLNNGSYSIHTDRLLKEVNKTDVVFVPALFGDMTTAVGKNRTAIPWLLDQYNKGAEIASLCVGAFLLASTGLLNGKKCSTHWGFQSEFREKFPDVNVVEGNIVTEEKRIYTSGGANSYWNLLLHLLEKYTNRETAILASKYFAIDIDRNSQAVFSMFKGQKDHNDTEILKAQKFIEDNVHEKITIDELADKTFISRRTFERRFKQATNNSVLEYIHRVKIETAKRSFETSRKNINEVMFDVGYSDTKAFRNMFRKVTGLSPIEYRNKYNKLVLA
jgi:transcriptional regulator GlxA family with amidase domain